MTSNCSAIFLSQQIWCHKDNTIIELGSHLLHTHKLESKKSKHFVIEAHYEKNHGYIGLHFLLYPSMKTQYKLKLLSTFIENNNKIKTNKQTKNTKHKKSQQRHQNVTKNFKHMALLKSKQYCFQA